MSPKGQCAIWYGPGEERILVAERTIAGHSE